MSLSPLLRKVFFAGLVRPVLMFIVGINIRNRHKLPKRGPAMVVANHNSHMDTLALISLFPLSILPNVRAVAAADHFSGSGPLGWAARNLVGILPIDRKLASRKDDPLQPITDALDAGNILIFYPEGTRGEPEQRGAFKKGIARLRSRRPEVPITPVFLRGFGRVLPRGAWIPVPLYCDIAVGEPLEETATRAATMEALETTISELSVQIPGNVAFTDDLTKPSV